CILARDLDETEHFYCNGLGLKKQFEFRKDDEMIGYYLAAGSTTFIEVFRGDPTGAPAGIRHFCLQTEDLDRLRRSLLLHGFPASESKFGCDNATQFWTRDPNGIDIEIQQYTDRSLQIVGGFALIMQQ